MTQPTRRQVWGTALALAIVAWLIYLPSIRYGFIYYDDVRILKLHPELYGQSNLGADLRAIFIENFPREEPLLVRDVSWAIDSRLFGFGNAFGYHLGNVLLHGIVVALLFSFLLLSTRRYLFSLIVAVCFLALAIHTEPVAWIMGRKDLLSTAFMLLALIAQMFRIDSATSGRKVAWYFATLLFVAGALLSKINALTLPIILLLHAVCLPYLRANSEANPFWRSVWRELLWTVPAFAIAGATYRWYSGILNQFGLFERGYTAHGLAHLWNLAMTNAPAFWIYLKQIFLPTDLRMYYEWPVPMASYSGGRIALSLGTIAALMAIGVWLFRRRKDLFFYFAAFFVLMVPYLNIVYIGIWVAERYVYFSAFCLLALVVAVAEKVIQGRALGIRVAVLCVALISFGLNVLGKVVYLPAWRTAETLWQYHIALPDPSPTAFENLAAYYYAESADAVSLQKMSVVVDAGLKQFWPDRNQMPPPKTAHLFFLRALFQQVTGHLDAACESLTISDRLRPNSAATTLNLARLYRELSEAAKSDELKIKYMLQARDRFATYIKLEFRGGTPPPDIQQELASLESDLRRITGTNADGKK